MRHHLAMQDLPASPDPLISTAEATEILGYRNASSVARLVYEQKLVPAHKLAGPRGAYLFHRADVVALAAQRSATKAVAS